LKKLLRKFSGLQWNLLKTIQFNALFSKSNFTGMHSFLNP
jgi:hypothetical protein